MSKAPGKCALLAVVGLSMATAALGQSVFQGEFRSGGRAVRYVWSPMDRVEPAHIDLYAKERLGRMGWAWSQDQKKIPGGYRISFEGSDAWGVLTRELIVGLSESVDFRAMGLSVVRALDFSPNPTTWLVAADSPVAAARACEELAKIPQVSYVHPNFSLEVEARSGQPEDAPLFPQQWNLSNRGQSGGTPGADIGVEAAWRVTLGAPTTIVADIDLGFEQSHHAMAGAWYVNRGEIPGNGIDDDHNGLKDDVSGWNFAINGANLIYGAANKHGTATSGIIGARLGGHGTVGICPECTILPLVIDNTPATAIAAFNYARAAGASVVSNSWGYAVGTPATDGVVEAIRQMTDLGRGGKGVPVVFAMSNFDRDDCRSTNPDISSLPTVIAVSATDHNDIKVGPTGRGPCLAIVAPSSGTPTHGIATVDRVGANGYNLGGDATNFSDPDFTNTFYGTSAAAPQVAGVLALLVTAHPEASKSQLIQALEAGADKVQPQDAAYDGNGHSNVYGYGRLNGGRAMGALSELMAP